MLTMVAAAAVALGQAPPPKIDDLRFMVGAWSCAKWGGEFQEHWIAPEGGVMMGVGRLIVDGKARFMEFLSIEPGEKGLVMWILLGSPSRGPKEGVPFTLSSFGGGRAVFENPKNDFPSKITYQAKKGGLYCRIEGIENGKAKSEDFEFRSIGARPEGGR